MFSYAVVSVLLVSSVFAWPQPAVSPQPGDGAESEDAPSILSQLPQEWQQKLPAHVQKDLKSITEKDLSVLKNVIEQFPEFKSLKEVRQAIKQDSPRLESLLEQHAIKGMAFVAKKRSQLVPGSRSFLKQATEISKTYVKSIANLAKSQTPDVINNLDTTLPHVSAFFNSPLFTQFLEHLERN